MGTPCPLPPPLPLLRAPPALCYLSQATPKKQKLDLLILSSLGLLPHSVLPPFMKVSQSTTLAGPSMRKTWRGVTSAASYHWFPAPPQLSSCSLEAAGRLWTLALEVLCPVSPNTAHRPQPKPTSNSHPLNTIIQNCPGSLGASQDTRPSTSVVPTQTC